MKTKNLTRKNVFKSMAAAGALAAVVSIAPLTSEASDSLYPTSMGFNLSEQKPKMIDEIKINQASIETLERKIYTRQVEEEKLNKKESDKAMVYFLFVGLVITFLAGFGEIIIDRLHTFFGTETGEILQPPVSQDQ